MKLELVVAISAFAAMPSAQAQERARPPTKEQVQKVVQSITGDQIKAQQYCEIGRLNRQMAAANQNNDTKTVEALGKQIDDLALKLGPEFSKLMDALDEIDDSSREGREIMTEIEKLDKLCADKPRQ
jgi:hypothetical protein